MPHISAEDFRCKLERNNTRLAFFIGAGVSYDSPASLPLAVEWKAALIEGLLGRSTIRGTHGLMPGTTDRICQVYPAGVGVSTDSEGHDRRRLLGGILVYRCIFVLNSCLQLRRRHAFPSVISELFLLMESAKRATYA
jgi:hypothetical protein